MGSKNYDKLIKQKQKHEKTNKSKITNNKPKRYCEKTKSGIEKSKKSRGEGHYIGWGTAKQNKKQTKQTEGGP